MVEQERGKNFVANSLTLIQEPPFCYGTEYGRKEHSYAASGVVRHSHSNRLLCAAESAELPVFKKMFSRIGASDSISEGLSTFMVELKETAEILRSADSSL